MYFSNHTYAINKNDIDIHEKIINKTIERQILVTMTAPTDSRWNHNTTLTLEGEYKLFFYPWNIIYLVFTTLTILIGITLNLLTMYLYYKRKIQHTNFHYTLQYISVTGILQQVGFIPFALVHDFEPNTSNLLVSIECGATYGLTIFFGAAIASVYIICFLSIERYLIIKKPFTSLKFSTKLTRNFVIVVSIASFGISLPNMITFKTDKYGFCIRAGVSSVFSATYAGINVSLGLVIPTVVMTAAYVMTIYHLFKPSEKQNLARKRHRKKVVKSIGILIGVFLLCWTPFSVNWLLSFFSAYENSQDGLLLYRRVNRVVTLPPLMVPILNNVIYGMTKQDIRSLRNSVHHGYCNGAFHLEPQGRRRKHGTATKPSETEKRKYSEFNM
ncbi:G-protein coupled receptor 87-like [Clytia hemisphaerica]|uniref:G-protein coupled receptor 87-like n=1 Tax=Clytia hemisphaerica TaxID=252671 RepID=UPI0034D480D5